MKLSISILSLVFCLCLAGIGESFGQEDAAIRDNLRRMRVKQQDEEGSVRIQHFINQQITTDQCTPVQQSRQRIEDIEASQGKTESEDVNITAGHGELNVTSNNGTINSDINIQIIKQGETKKCL